jgi:E3 ubiquitin-protein ligase TRIP12
MFISTRKATQPPTPAALIINEPTRDPKGKKRAAPESISEDESAAPSSKKPRGSSSSYSLRSKAQQMPKKARFVIIVILTRV